MSNFLIFLNHITMKILLMINNWGWKNILDIKLKQIKIQGFNKSFHMPTLKNLTRNSFPYGLRPGRVLWAAEIVVVDEKGRTHGLRKPCGRLQTHAGAILEKITLMVFKVLNKCWLSRTDLTFYYVCVGLLEYGSL